DYASASAPDYLRNVEALAETWSKVDPYNDDTDVGYFLTVLGDDGAPKTPWITTARTGLSWIYGDLVHADDLERRHGETAATTTIVQLYSAAGLLVTRVAFGIICTLNVMCLLRVDGHLGELGEDIWSEKVSVQPEDLVQPLLSAEVIPHPPATAQDDASQEGGQV
ncbi:MAG TPA: hypothetical protein VN108_11355, partial [Marmoricola sp.]|nr:hypothetical protein [Marmoricola sp.]